VQSQPIIDLAFEYWLPFLRAIPLAMDDLGTANPAVFADREEFITELFGIGTGQTVEVQFQFPGDSPSLEVSENSLLDTGPGEEEVCEGFDFPFGEGVAFFLLSQVPGLVDRVGGWQMPPMFRPLQIERGDTLDLRAEEQLIIRVEVATHGRRSWFQRGLGQYTGMALVIGDQAPVWTGFRGSIPSRSPQSVGPCSAESIPV
jgi:hypothetical protein